MNQFKEGDLVHIKNLPFLPRDTVVAVSPTLYSLFDKTGIIEDCIQNAYDSSRFPDADGCAYLVNGFYFNNMALEKVEKDSNELLTINFK